MSSLFVLVIFILFAIFAYKRKSPRAKGNAGERKAARTTEQYFHSFSSPGCNAVKTLYNLYLPWPNGSTAEIDELIISESGIFVLEVKNYGGWIFGDQKNRYWTQTLPRGGFRKGSEKHRFFNPIIQNEYHISCIRKNINNMNVPFHSLIVFSDQCTFKNLSYDASKATVVHRSGLKRAISDIESLYKCSISKDDINLIYGKLIGAGVADKNVRRAHIDGIAERKQKNSVSAAICPRCGSGLVLRTAKQGMYAGSRFYGCSSFPKCRYIRKV